MIEKYLSLQTIEKLSLVVAGKANADDNIEDVVKQVLKNYQEALTCFESLNTEYRKANPVKKVTKKPEGF